MMRNALVDGAHDCAVSELYCRGRSDGMLGERV